MADSRHSRSHAVIEARAPIFFQGAGELSIVAIDVRYYRGPSYRSREEQVRPLKFPSFLSRFSLAIFKEGIDLTFVNTQYERGLGHNTKLNRSSIASASSD
jgi:hypothetical protein